MPITQDLQLPIAALKISGPAVEELRLRKEDNNNTPVSGAELSKNFETIRDSLFAGLKAVVSPVGSATR